MKQRPGRSAPRPRARIRSKDIRLRELRMLPARLFGQRKPLIALVTGSNGKTTTTNMIAKIMSEAGHSVGRCTTEGISFADETVWSGDASGYKGAGWVLTEPGVTAAALETARGGIINNGLYMTSADVAVMTNIQREHVGDRGIDTPEQMAAVKKRVLDVARRAVVLNADDPICLRVARTFPVEKTILFSMDAENEVIIDHAHRGGRALALKGTVSDGRIVLLSEDGTTDVIAVTDMPSVRGGALPINIANGMAAAGLGIGMDIPIADIALGLGAFDRSDTDNPGRFSFRQTRTLPIMVSYGSNPSSLVTTLPAIAAMTCGGAKYCMISAPDDRPDEHFEKIAQALVGQFDWYLPFELGKFVRRRSSGWVPAEIAARLKSQGIPEERILTFSSLEETLRFVVNNGTASDLGIMFGTPMYEFDLALEAIGAGKPVA